MGIKDGISHLFNITNRCYNIKKRGIIMELLDEFIKITTEYDKILMI